jgi:hypothetical protein
MKPAALAPYRPLLAIFALLAATSALLRLIGSPRLDDTVCVRLPLPAAIGEFRGSDILFCQDQRCLRSYRLDTLKDLSRCPACGGALDPISLGERRVLPADVILARKQYLRRPDASALVTVLVNGKERTGIHRPQMCLEGQGWQITGHRVVRIPLAGREPLSVMLLDVVRLPRDQYGPRRPQEATFAYWFTDGTHETPYHVERMLLMAADNVLRGISRRWAYVTVLLQSGADREAERKQIEALIAALHPMLATADSTAQQSRNFLALCELLRLKFLVNQTTNAETT